jgi:hypothetical protein
VNQDSSDQESPLPALPTPASSGYTRHRIFPDHPEHNTDDYDNGELVLIF